MLLTVWSHPHKVGPEERAGQLAQASFCLFAFFSLLILSPELCSHTIVLLFLVTKAQRPGKIARFKIILENIKMVIETSFVFSTVYL